MPVPANNDFANAVAISTASGTDTSVTTIESATVEAGEPKGTQVSTLHHTVWWKWTCPTSGDYVFRTDGATDLDTNMAVWTGTTLAGLTEVTSNDDLPYAPSPPYYLSRCRFTATAGTDYYIQVGTYYETAASAAGPVTLIWEVAGPHFTTYLDRASDTIGSLSGAVSNTLRPLPTDNPLGSAAITVVGAPSGMTVTFPTATLNEVSGPRTFTTSVDATVASGIYPVTIRSTDSGTNGDVVDVTYTVTVPPPPSNDNLADRIVLTGASGSDGPVTIDYATLEASEVYGHQTIWYEWTAAATGNKDFWTYGSLATDLNGDCSNRLDTQLFVYTAPTNTPGIGDLVDFAFNDDSSDQPVSPDCNWTSWVTLAAVAGTTYYIKVGTYGSGYTGTAILSYGTYVTQFAPTPADDDYTLATGATLTVNAASGVLANDAAATTATLNTGPTNGSLTLNSDGSFVYTKTAGFYGTDSFTYDGNGGTATATIHIPIPPVPRGIFDGGRMFRDAT